MNKLKILLICSLLLSALAACGQKGPLYLPEGEQSMAPGEETGEEEEDGA
jgi:predicted small lipoprotein YifL